MQHLTSSQAFWLGHFYQASRSGLSLPSYARQQGLSLAELLLWRKRLQTIGVVLPQTSASLFAVVEVVA